MPVINSLIAKIENSHAGSSIKQTLKTGTQVEVIKEAAKDTVRVVREKACGDKFTTTLKKINGKYVPKKVKEEYIFGLVNIEFKKDGSRLVKLRACNVNGRASQDNSGFFRMSKEENIFAKGVPINSPEKEMKIKRSEKNADVSFLLLLKRLRQNNRYCMHDRNYHFAQDIAYMKSNRRVNLF